jgi:hypothetical protein
MSVILLKKEIERLADTLLMDSYGSRDYSRCVFNYREESQFRMLGVMPTEDDIKNNILCWCNRLWWANQLAAFMTWSDAGRTLTDIEDGKLPAGHMNPGDLYRDLCSIKYNLYANSGRMMLSADDLEKLDTLTQRVADRIINAGQDYRGTVNVD